MIVPLVVLIVSFLAAIAVAGLVSERSIRNGDSPTREWTRRMAWSAAAFVAVWAAYFIIGNLAAVSAS
jgi:CHASE1-domain containing sensor protein